MIAIAKNWEDMDAGTWSLEDEDVKDLTEQELTSLVLPLSTDRIYNHEGRSASRTLREIEHSLQYYPRAEMIIGAWSGKDAKVILKYVEETLTQSTVDEDMCPAETLGLYTADEQMGIVKEGMSHKMMLAILRKYLNR